ncbi:MAG: tRNA pseudouridine(38-40) synthase TruA [Dissulfurispiraceae bacterium]|jgi:tRNA pseudouridine38-40 synthase|nr:tRNA pseudouridine(38-40) synthase TruA [Dissulfurispiraceae bacterium]
MRNIALLIQYDGTDYSGWQLQSNTVTLQGVIEEKISTIAGRRVNLVAAGRTDAGVHSLGQVAAFKTESAHSPLTFKNALNALLPPDIRIMNAAYAADSFHPRFDALKKSYIYTMTTDKTVSPFIHRYVWRLQHHLDIAAMKEAVPHILGRYDFSAFRGSGCGAKTPVRSIISINIEENDSAGFISNSIKGSFIILRFEADAFLRHMVRNITGTLTEIGRGRLYPEDMKKILDSKDRKNAGPTAPASGLFMERVCYKDMLWQ